MQTVAHTVTHILVRTTSGERVVDVERQRKPRVQICVNEAAAAEGVHGSQSTVPIGIMTRTRVGLPFSVAFLSRVDMAGQGAASSNRAACPTKANRKETMFNH